MSQVNKPLFRADHVGSLLRPPELLQTPQETKGGYFSRGTPADGGSLHS